MNQKKFQYNDYEEDVVRASQYIFLENDEERHAIFNFHNQFTESIKSMTFFVVQYDEEDEILSRAKLRYDGFVCEAGAYFVPKLKLILNDTCDHLEIYVLDATFDNFYLIDGIVHEIQREEEDEEEVREEEIAVTPPYFDVSTISQVGKSGLFMLSIAVVAFLTILAFYFIFGIGEVI